MNGQMGHLQKTMRSRTNLIFAVLLLVAGAVMSAVAWPAVLQAQNTSSLNLSSLSVTDQNGTTVTIGTFDPATTTYSGSVASTVERITVEAVASAGASADIHITPLDSQPATSGHQVDLSHGTNLILVSVHSFHLDEVLKTYELQITRAGTAATGTANVVSISEGYRVREGSTVPFLLTRTGDTSQALTVQIDIAEFAGDKVLASSEGQVDVAFQAGHASARHDVATTDDSMAFGTSSVQATVVAGTGYTADTDSIRANWHIWEDDYWRLNLESITVTDQDSTEVDIGTFNPDVNSYSANVASSVERVTIGYAAPISIRAFILPGDSQSGELGHQVELAHGNNIILVPAMDSTFYTRSRADINIYSLEINRAGSAPVGSSTTVGVQGPVSATEGELVPFVLNRTGDTSQSLTVQVDVSETGGDMVSASSKGRKGVEFQAGYATARINVMTNPDEDWEEHSTVEVEVTGSSDYQVSPTSGSASTTVKDNDFPDMTAALSLDSTQASEGDEITATITVTTDGPKEPHEYVGNLRIVTRNGTAGEDDFQLNGSNNATHFLNSFMPVITNGVTTSFQSTYSAPIEIIDDERAEPDETFDVAITVPYRNTDALVLDQASSSLTATILGEDEAPQPYSEASYVTVSVADSGSTGSTFTISWHNPEGCEGEYSAYLWGARGETGLTAIEVTPWGERRPSPNQSHFLDMGSTDGGNTQMVKILTYVDLVDDQYRLAVHCEGLVGIVPLPSQAGDTVERPKPGTYSSEAPLTNLSISSGTLTPAFNKDGFLYAVLDVPNDDEQVTFTATARSGYSISWDPATDVDSNTDGHQVDLAVGYNTIYANVEHDDGASSFVYEVIVKRAEAVAEANTAATGAPSITGTAQVGEALTADTSGIADADGLTSATFVYQWLADDAEIPGATGTTYVLTSNEMDKAIKVRVSFTDDSGNNEGLTSAATAAVSPAVLRQQSNTPAIGAPAIVGTVQVGEPLTADTSGISDTDGITGVSYSYQWVRNDGTSDTDITGAAASIYTLVDADEGKTIKVKVSFADDADNGETLTSAATATVAARPIPGSAPDTPDQPVGNAVFAGGVDLEWNDVPGADSYDVQLYRTGQWMDLPGDGVEIAFYGAGAIINELNPGSTHWFQVRATSAHGSSDWSDFRQVGSTNQSTLGKRARPDNVTASGAPVINGTAQVGESLTADTTGIEDGNGLGRVQFRFQWVSNDGSADADITGATDSTYTLVAADEGKAVKVRVSFTDRGGYAESLTSAATDSIRIAVQQHTANSPATGTPTITGTAQVGETLTADTSGIADNDGLTNVSYDYQWIRNDGSSDTDIQDATGSTYTLAAADEGKTIKVKVSFRDDADNEETLTSAATTSVAARPNQVATGTPSISGTAQVGETLTADTAAIDDADGLTNVSYSYQWIRNDGSSDTDITGETDSTYTLEAVDEGKTVKVRVSFTDDANNDETLTSTASAPVAARPNQPATGQPTISGVPRTTKTLDVSTYRIRDPDGLDNASFSYQWLTGDGTTYTDITGATGRSYTIKTADVGKSIKVMVTFTDDADNSETVTSDATVDVVAADTGVCSRSPGIRDYIVRLIYGIFDCGFVTEEHLASLTMFLLSGNEHSVNSLKAGDFAGLSNVDVFYLTGTDVTELPDGIFNGLSSVEDLRIESNESLSELPDGVFDDLTSLRNLGVVHNAIEELPDGAFEDLSSLESLDLRANNLSAVQDGAFDDLTRLTNLSLNNNELTEIPEGAFDNLAKIERLDLGKNALTSLPDGAFDNMPALEYLYVHGNQLTALPEGVFEGLSNLVSVHFADNPGAPFLIAAELEQQGDDEVVVQVSKGAPFDTEVTLTAVGGVLSGTTVTVEGGDNSSEAVTVTPDGDGAVVVRIVSIELDAVPVRQRGISPSRGAPVGVSDSDADNTSAEGVPTISGTTQVGQTLIASTSGITDADGLTNVQFSYQWVRNDGTTDHDIPGATGFSYNLTSSEVENTIKVLVTFADDSGNHDIVTSGATGAVTPLPNTEAHGYPTIHGSAVLGQTLTATTAGMEDANGLSNATFRFQWFNSYQSRETDETVYYEVAWYHGGTERTYTLRNDDVSRKIMVQVSYVDDGGNPESLTSEPTAAVVRPSGTGGANTPAAGSLALSGTAKVGETLTADISGITDDNGLVGVSFSYTWSANDGLLLGQSVVPTYTIRPKDVGLGIDVTVHFTDDDGYHEQTTSTATSAVQAATPAPPQNLKVSKEGKGSLDLKWDTPVVDMEGLRNGKGTKGDGGSPIRKYKVQWKESANSWDTPEEVSEDAVQNTTHTIGDLTGDTQYDVRVVATNDVGDGAASEQVSGTPQLGNAPAVGIPTISGTAQVGETLTASTSGINDSDGITSVSYNYQWIRNDGSSDTDITGATDSTYSLDDADEGKTVKVKVGFTDDAGSEESLTSAATAAVSARPDQGSTPDTPDQPVGTAVFVGGVDLEWNDVPGADSYDVQLFRNGQWTVLPGDGVAIAFYGAGAIISELDPSSTHWFQVRARNADGSSDWSDYRQVGSTNQSSLGKRARPDNVTASGAPVINGTVQVGESLAADAAGIEDGNGLDRVQFRFQWVSNDGGADADITGATDSSYTLVAADEGKTVKVRVSFTDRGGYAESLTSAATETVSFAVQEQVANSPATGAPTITGTAQVGQTLTADTSAIADTDGLTNVSYSYQWIRNDGTSDTDITGATDSTYTLVGADEGKTIKAKVSFTDDADGEESLTSAASDTVVARPNSPATGAPTISGTTQVGETLTADTSGIADSDGLANVSHSYQWVRNDGTSDTDITGATASTHTLVAADEGKTIKVSVSFTDDQGNAEILTSAATAAVDASSNNPPTGAPTISGTAQVGETLTADTSGIADSDGLANVSHSYQWVRNDGTSDTDITGATDSSYTLVDADAGKTVKVKVSFTDDADNGETLTSPATAAVDAAPNSPATGAPSISGTAQVGQTLTADTSAIADADGLDTATFTYQWVANDGTSDTDIAGATGSSYTLVNADEGKTIRVRVSFTDDAGNDETLTGAATAAVDAAPNNPATGAPSITGTAQVGETLTAETSGIADADGLTSVSYSYQWIRNDGSSDTDIQNAADSTYTLVDADEGKIIKVKVGFTDDAGHGETLPSAATGIVAAALLPLTVSLENNTATHNGTDVFTFEIRFSEEFPLSFRTLKLHAFTVTGGTVKKAQRVDNSSDIHWRITVQPDSNGNVTIVLPTTTDCGSTGAICTGDGRMLSNSLNFTVSGPGG